MNLLVDLMRAKEIGSEEVQMINYFTSVDDHSMYTCINWVALCFFNSPIGKVNDSRKLT